MSEICNSSSKNRWGWGASLLVMSMALGAGAAQAQEVGDEETIVVTGFRGSLAASLNVKREATGFVDAITAEDIADFPDANLAEAIQRIPGVAIDRDAGEGRSITVRGLGADFTRVRINGMEGLTTTGGTDSSGGLNRSRQFDFNVFASELFNSIRVAKSASASTEEGSLGATVDLSTARPFDYDGFTFAASGQTGFNDLSEEWDPRGALLVSNTWADGKFGALFSIAYSNRSLVEDGFQAVRWWDAPNAAAAAAQWDQANDGAQANNSACPNPNAVPCGAPTGTQRFSWEDPAWRSDPAALAAARAAGNFFPRIPRASHYAHEQDRIGVTTSLQWRPSSATLVNFDFLFSSFQATRQEDFLQNFGFSRTAGQGGIGSIDVVQAQFDANGELDFGEFYDDWILYE